MQYQNEINGYICFTFLVNYLQSMCTCYIQAFFFISTQNEVGSTPLIGASENGHVSTCDFLIDHGAHVDLGMKVRLFY